MNSTATNPHGFRGGALALGILAGLLYVWAQVSSAIEPPTEGRSSRAASKTGSTSSGGGKEAQILSRLDEILANQRAILEKFDAVMEELRIIKIRATRRN